MLDLSFVSFVTVFAAGIISFVTPCVLPLVPAYLSYIAGEMVTNPLDGLRTRRRLAAVNLSLCFVLGFATVFVLLGAGATALGQLMLNYRYELNIVSGLLVMLFGFFMLGVYQPAALQRDLRFRSRAEGGRPVAAYVLGLAFAFGWTPCIGPILGAILSFTAARTTISDGMALLAVYSLGLGLPFVLAAYFTEALIASLGAIGRVGRNLQRAGGGIMVLMGLAMLTGQLSALSYWLLETFPLLGTLG